MGAERVLNVDSLPTIIEIVRDPTDEYDFSLSALT